MEFDEVEKVYDVDPLKCPKCSFNIEIKVIIMESAETEKILRHLVKIGRAPPNFDITSLN